MTVKVRILLGEATTIGPGKIALLEAIDRHGSIAAAARQFGMSYRRAWRLVDAMNQDFVAPLVETATGGSGGGGARLTVLGTEVIGRYRVMTAMAAARIETELSVFARLLAAPRLDNSHRLQKNRA
ncbi:MAG: molybdate transport system regulatory protein [Rhodospirillaceae bacterium]|nr:MAG: molybdate transport system regulatory protein [Rhodospirillaceae bacterium]